MALKTILKQRFGGKLENQVKNEIHGVNIMEDVWNCNKSSESRGKKALENK